ncbi:MAG: hypothetical protein GY771_02035 [bacterium]|nr:hypothetical protein [bacterium]
MEYRKTSLKQFITVYTEEETMDKKTKIGLIAGIPVTLVLVIIVAVLIWVNVFLPKYVAENVNEYLPENTSVGKVTAAFPAGVTLHDFNVEQPDNFGVYGSAEEVTLKLSLFSFLLGQINESSVKEIEIEDFDVIIKAKPKEPELLPPVVTPEKPKGENPLEKLFGFGSNRIGEIPGGPPPIPSEPIPLKPPVAIPVETPDTTRASEYQVEPGGNMKFDCEINAENGTIRLQRGDVFQDLAEDIVIDGDISEGLFDVSIDAAPTIGGSLTADCVIALDMSNGVATYKADTITIEGYIEKFDRPKWIKSARGEMNMYGSFAWRKNGLPLHEAEMTVNDGVVRFNAKKLKVDFERINGRFWINNDEIGAEDAGFVFADAEWSIEGKVGKAYIDLTFAVKDFGLQNLIEMVVEDFPLVMIGRGDVTIRLIGPTYFPEVKVNIKKVRL